MLAKLGSNQLRKEIKEQDGILIYTFISAHVNRAIGSMHSLAWGSNTPFYSIDDNGSLIKGSSFYKSRPLLSSIYNILSLSQIIKYYRLDFPLYITNDHINLTCRLITESARHFEKQFNSKKFYVVFYPTSKYSQRIGRCLQELEIKILDYPNLFSESEKLVISKYNTHPNPKAYRILSQRLVKDIGIIDNGMEKESIIGQSSAPFERQSPF